MRKSGLVLIGPGLLLLSGCAGTGHGCGAGEHGALVGAWRSTVQFEDGAFAQIKDLEFLYAFNAGGTMTESSNYDSAPPVPPAYGVWRSLGRDRFECVYVFYMTKPPEDPTQLAGGWTPAGRGELVEQIELAPDGRAFTSTLTLSLFDEAGAPVEGGGRATGHGARIGF